MTDGETQIMLRERMEEPCAASSLLPSGTDSGSRLAGHGGSLAPSRPDTSPGERQDCSTGSPPSRGVLNTSDSGTQIPRRRPLRSLAAPWIAATVDGPYRFRICDWARDYSYHATLEAARDQLEEASDAQLAFADDPFPIGQIIEFPQRVTA